jgi:NAD-dependent DNA ligase
MPAPIAPERAPVLLAGREELMQSSAPVISTILEGKRFVLLGKFQRKKHQICDLILSHSGIIPKSSHLSNKVSFVLYGTGSESTAKFKKAQEKQIPTLTEDQLLAMLTK